MNFDVNQYLVRTSLKSVTKADAMQQTFTDGFAGEIKCNFSNVPVY